MESYVIQVIIANRFSTETTRLWATEMSWYKLGKCGLLTFGIKKIKTAQKRLASVDNEPTR